MTMVFRPGKKSRLYRKHLQHFAGPTLFDRVARTVCAAEAVPRKELYEAWEVARRIRRRFRGGPIIDLAAGHGLLAWLLLVLDDSSPSALCVDVRRPRSAERLERSMLSAWPRLAGRVTYSETSLDDVQAPDDAVLGCVHGCGDLTDRVLEMAIARGLRVAVLPCCQSASACDPGDLLGWLPIDLAVDATRVAVLRQAGFKVWTSKLPPEVTPKNRLLLARPGET